MLPDVISGHVAIFQKFSWGGKPPDPSSKSMLCMLGVPRTLAIYM